MRHKHVSIFLALACFLGSPLSAQDLTPEIDQEVESLIQSYEARRAAFRRAMQKAESMDERRKLSSESPVRAELWIPRFRRIADAAPASEAGFKALMWLRNNGSGVSCTEALELLLEHHLTHKDLGPVTRRFVGAPTPTDNPRAPVVMRKILKENPHEAVKSETAFNLARWLRHHHPYQKRGEIIELLTYTREHGRKVRGIFPFPNLSLAEIADAELFQLKHLQIGRLVPDIVGEDLDGDTFKLSDYRGKVVLLDFWGHW